ncbi:protein of unknown function (plasmid) [Cupriavidus taiwanensis]|uniref:Uncharacterized protein n=1 Tax=Cupriavidus taiwanensis TaxID=164546 RepID=A0A375FGH1_9BURK|nr:protein of unknown function [Cupriavidus taiwanensis]SOZ72175.1 protein of unknown function [Cupriavidus taiwanensis]SOZ74473.1 protein of unknown function [Cupriavidus taiwanensis]SPA03382.1 protein of unknown function [Cupriavidus taiwanensis]SPA57123.1 protein of unknown function [Cupriavidus taiwanensis]
MWFISTLIRLRTTRRLVASIGACTGAVVDLELRPGVLGRRVLILHDTLSWPPPGANGTRILSGIEG